MWNKSKCANKSVGTIPCIVYRLPVGGEGGRVGEKEHKKKQGRGEREIVLGDRQMGLSTAKTRAIMAFPEQFPNPTQKTWHSHLWAFENKLARRHRQYLCQQTKTIDPCWGRQSDWLMTCDHNSFVQNTEVHHFEHPTTDGLVGLFYQDLILLYFFCSFSVAYVCLQCVVMYF